MVFLHFSCQLGGEKFKETLSSFLASFADRAAFSLRLPSPTSLKEIDEFPTPSLPRKRFIPKGYTESRYVGRGGESEAQGNSEFSQYPALGVSLPTLSYRLDTRRPGEKEGGKERAPGARRALAPLTRVPASPVLKAGNGLFITCFSCSHFLGTSDKQEFAPHASFLRRSFAKLFTGKNLGFQGSWKGLLGSECVAGTPSPDWEFPGSLKAYVLLGTELGQSNSEDLAQRSGPAHVQLTPCLLPCSPSRLLYLLRWSAGPGGRSALPALPMPAITTHRRRACQAQGQAQGFESTLPDQH